jgi:glycogen operon protein
MIVAGDEFGRTQQGNNNAYCQDNELSWLHWENMDHELQQFTASLIKLRKQHPTFCRRKWFQGMPVKGIGLEDIAWFLPEGTEMDDEHWQHDFARSLAVYLNGKGIRSLNEQGEKIIDDDFYVMFNAHHDTIIYHLPPDKYSKKWLKVLDTYEAKFDEETVLQSEDEIPVKGRSVVLLKAIQA